MKRIPLGRSLASVSADKLEAYLDQANVKW